MGNKKNRSFEENTIIVFCLSILSSSLAYIYQLMLGRFLSVEMFGDINTIISLLSIGTAYYIPVGMYICVEMSKSVCDNDTRKNRFAKDYSRLFVILELVTLPIGLILCFIFLPSIGTVKTYFLFIGLLCENGLFCVLQYSIQGTKEYLAFGIINVVLNVLKIVFLVIGYFTAISLDVILVWLLVSYAVTIVAEVLLIVKLCDVVSIECIQHSDVRRQLCKLLIPVISQIALFNGVELVLVRYMYSSKEAGLYSVAISIAKIGIFLTTPVCAVLLPEVASTGEDKKKKRLLYKAIKYSICVIAIYLGMVWLFRTNIINILYGEKYLEAVKYFTVAFIFVIALVAYNIIYNYQIANGITAIYTLSALVVLFVIIVMTTFLNSIKMFITVSGCLILGTSIIQLCTLKGKDEKSRNSNTML